MSSVAKQGGRAMGRPPLAMPVQIQDTPENVAKAILSTRRKKPDEWKFDREYKASEKVVSDRTIT